jgi:hypothetical protein
MDSASTEHVDFLSLLDGRKNRHALTHFAGTVMCTSASASLTDMDDGCMAPAVPGMANRPVIALAIVVNPARYGAI